MIKVPLNKEELIELTKNYPGIRQKINKDGSFEVYISGGTFIVDIVKNIIREVYINGGTLIINIVKNIIRWFKTKLKC